MQLSGNLIISFFVSAFVWLIVIQLFDILDLANTLISPFMEAPYTTALVWMLRGVSFLIIFGFIAVAIGAYRDSHEVV